VTSAHFDVISSNEGNKTTEKRRRDARGGPFIQLVHYFNTIFEF